MSATMFQTERDLVRGCRDGDPAAQRALYERYAGTMYGVCMRYAKDDQFAQDMLQDGFIRVFDKLHTFRGEGSLEGWVRRLIVNVAIRHCQKAARLYVVTDLEEAALEAGPETIEGMFAQEELLDLIRSLPEGYRLVFNLYAVEGFSHKEIADKLGISEGTSKSQLARARASLRRSIEQLSAQAKKKMINETTTG